MKKSLPLILALLPLSLFAGPGHDHGDEPGAQPAAVAQGPLRLTLAMTRNLGLETAEVELRTLEKTFPALGHIEADQSKVAAVTSRIPGRVTRLAVHAGQRVKAGELLLEVESRIVADPPPRLTFNAPRDGVVLDLHAIVGDAVEPEKHLLTIADLTEVFAVAKVYEGQIASIRTGQKVRVRPVAYPTVTFDGEVIRTAASLDRDTGTLQVFVRVANAEGKLLPGMRTQLAFVTEESDAAVVVPRAAVLGEGGDLFVFRQVMTGPFTYERVPVEIGLRDDRFIEIIDGVLPGDRVVTRGNYQLQYVGGAAAKIEDDHGHSHGPGGEH
jgi:cobalt-zinc-cadmium efflux system membrane fusion protein